MRKVAVRGRFPLDLGRVVRRFRQSTFFGNVAKVGTGSAIAQIIALACAPILTRLYAPEAFGLLGMFLAVMAVLSTTATFRYDLALILPKLDSAAWALLKVAALVTVGVVFVTFLTTFPFRHLLAGLFDTPGLEAYFILIPILILGAGWLALASGWAIRVKDFGSLGRTTISSSVAGNAFKIGAGFIGFGGGALIIATAFQQWFHFLALSFRLRPKIPLERRSLSEGWHQAKLYSEFPKYRMPQDALSIFANQIPNLLLALFFSPVIVGLYLLTVRVIQAPAGVLRESVRKVFYQKVAETNHQKGDLVGLVDRMTLIMAAFSVPAILVFIFFGPQIFGLVFGEQWLEAGRYSRYVIVMIALGLCNVPGVAAVTAIGKNKELLFFGVFSALVRIVAIIVGGYYLSPEATVAVYALTCALKDFALILWARHTLIRYRVTAV